MKNTLDQALEMIKRGTSEIITEEELVEKLKRSQGNKIPLNVKAGFDPSAPDLHLGHTVVLQKLKQFQDLGHNVIFLIGDFTGMIGDPTGKSDTRKALSREEVLKNAETYKEQVFKILDEKKTRVAFNSEWMSKMNLEQFIYLTSCYTVARMLERDDFANRFKNNKPIGIHEFLYPLIQGYDSIALKADIELGGTDQKFNLLVGRDLQKKFDMQSQVAITMPILEGIDGVQKMSKSLGNYIGINEPPNEIFGKIMSISDELMIKYYILLSDVDVDELEKIRQGLVHPMIAKKNLAYEIVQRFHGQLAAKKALEDFEHVFSKKEVPDDLKVLEFKSPMNIVEIIKKVGFAQSNSEAKRLINQGGVYINNERISDVDILLKNGEYLLKVGKRKFVKIILINKENL
jgi:tyrosyl-tRNA synthetase